MPTSTHASSTGVSQSVRAGLALSFFVGAANFPFMIPDIIDWGVDGAPPLPLLALNAAIGAVSMVCAVIAWKDGNRRALRINAAALIFNAVMLLPGFFVDTTPTVTLITALGVVLTVIAVVLTMRRQPTPVSVTD